MKSKHIKLKIVDKKNVSYSPVIEIDVSRLSEEHYLNNVLLGKIALNLKREPSFLFIGTPESKLELEEVFRLLKATENVFKSETIVWDIINEPPKDDEPNDLNGYLILK